MVKDKTIAIFWLLVLTFFWGLTFPVQKNILTENVSPFVYNAVRFWIATVLSFIFFRIGDFKYGAILGIVLSIAYATQTWGLTLTTSTKSGFITSLYIVLIPIFSFLIEREKPKKIHLLGFFAALIGNYLLTDNLQGFNFGDFLTAICALMYAIHVVFVTDFSKKVEYTKLLTPQFLTVAIVNSFLGINGSWNIGLPAVGVALWTAVTATILALIIQLKYQKVVGSNTAGLIFVGEPLFAMILSMLILGDTLNTKQIWGIVIIILSLLSANF